MKVFELLKSELLNGYTFNVYTSTNEKLEKQASFYNYFDIINVSIDCKAKQVHIKIYTVIDVLSAEHFD